MEGLTYVPDVLSVDEEASLLAVLRGLEMRPIVMRGQTARRTTRHFGWSYGYESRAVEPTEPLPASLRWLQERAASVAAVESPDELAEVLITRYPPGAGIGWHRDAPMFGRVVGVSVGSPVRLRFRRRAGDPPKPIDVDVAPRSAYLLRGEARWQWQHAITSTPAERWSVTFRTLKGCAG